MARATPPDLDTSVQAVRALSRPYPVGHVTEPHRHDWGQLLYAQSGIMWVETPGEAVLVPPQRGVWLPPGVEHGLRVVSALEMRSLYLRPQQLGQLPGTPQVFEINPLLRELVLTLAAQESASEPEYHAALSALVVLELQRAPCSRLRVPLPQGRDRRLLELCRAVMAAPSQAHSFEWYAQRCGASVRTLTRLFPRELGMGFAEWRRQVQLAHAVAGLIQGQPVGRIARELGYRPNNFSDMFRRQLGVSPSRYALPAMLGVKTEAFGR